MNKFEPDVHGIGCVMAHTSRLWTLFPPRVPKWMPFKYVDQSESCPERLSKGSGLILFP